MNGGSPAVTIVIPTRDRPESLIRTLRSRSRPDVPAGHFEVVVVNDGSRELPLARAADGPGFALRVLPNRGRGASAARNTGAAAARAPVLLFLDDDIEASPALVRAHLEAHRRGASLTVGHLPALPAVATGFFAAALRNWWEAMFAEMRQPGHRFTFRDVLTGNCAIDAALFRRVGAFDVSLACHEDYELGVRAIAAGARLAFCEAAQGIHHEVTTLERALERKRAEGHADVALVRKHPELLPALPLGAAFSSLGPVLRGARRWPFTRRRATVALMAVLRRSLDLFEAARMRGRWHVRLYQLLGLAYWQGVASEVGTVGELAAVVHRTARACGRARRWLRVDLCEGLSRAEQRVESLRPDGIVVLYRGEAVGTLPPEPGAEPVHAAHLRAALAEPLAWPFLVSLGRSGELAVEQRSGRLVASGPLPRDPFNPR